MSQTSRSALFLPVALGDFTSTANATLLRLIPLRGTQPRSEASRSQAFVVGLVVAVPAAEGGVAGVGKQKGQRRRFNGAIAKDPVGYLELSDADSICGLNSRANWMP